MKGLNMAIDGTKVIEVRMDLIIDISRRVNEDITDLKQSTDNWGNEDYSDALDSVGCLFRFASAVMLANAYVTDYTGGGRLTREALEQQVRSAEEALSTLIPFGFNYTIADLTNTI